ncbi:hypothetical protein C0Q70_05776 [Pomacea canaliculata]|uniref:Aminopeptidase P N-terminal domain-containing protein n=1 Tax=Pomacea canaliculata TaxID=400727 RepID=A0A2T7PM52_POMCA|nr:hypothetical protein C0Q70_05776 [Pomacea canaliculata]
MPAYAVLHRRLHQITASCWQSVLSWKPPYDIRATWLQCRFLSMIGSNKIQCPWTSSHSVRRFGQPAAQTHPHLISVGEVTPGITMEEYRRPSKVFMTNDIPYPFRQNTDFLYLCGFQEPDSVLVILSSLSSTDNHKSVLFVPKKDPDKELWDGPRSGTDGALFLTGVDSALNFEELESYLAQFCRDHGQFMLWYDYIQPVQTHLHTHVMCEMIHQERHKGIENTTPLLHQLRLKKSSAEIELMKQTVEIASNAFMEVNEAHLWAKMDFECRLRGAQYLAYPPVVAGGVRANTIHYIANNQVIADGELVLMDAGCELHGYTSDLTRTWPVNGKFSLPQRELYEATLAVQKACIALCTTTRSLDQIYRQMLVLLGVQLQKIGVLPRTISATDLVKRTRELCPHHVGHYLGMDVHDTASMSRTIQLQPGMIVTIEPGIYVPVNDTLVPKKYRGIGIRIEDNILITEDGPLNLSQKCPKEADEIENTVQGR